MEPPPAAVNKSSGKRLRAVFEKSGLFPEDLPDIRTCFGRLTYDVGPWDREFRKPSSPGSYTCRLAHGICRPLRVRVVRDQCFAQRRELCFKCREPTAGGGRNLPRFEVGVKGVLLKRPRGTWLRDCFRESPFS